MSLRSIFFAKRVQATTQILESIIKKGEWVYPAKSGLFSPFDELEVVTPEKKICIKVRIYSFGEGKPSVKFGSEEYRERAIQLAKKLRAKGKYIFAPKVELDNYILDPPLARFLIPPVSSH